MANCLRRKQSIGSVETCVSFSSTSATLSSTRYPRRHARPTATSASWAFPRSASCRLSAVLKRAGHECVMFDQANPETPNEVIVEELKRQRPAVVGLSFLSTTSYPYAKILARQIRSADDKVKLAFGGVFATLNAELVKLQCPEVDFVCRGDGEQLILDLVERLDDPSGVAGLTWMKDGKPVHNSNRPMDRDSRSVAVPRSREPAARLRRVDAARRAGGSVDGTLHDHADLARLSVALRVLRHPDLQRGQVALAKRRARGRRVQAASASTVTAPSISSTTTSCCSRSASRRSAAVSSTTRSRSSGDARDASTPSPSISSPRWPRPIAGRIMFGIESGSQKMLDRLKKEQTLDEVTNGGHQREAGRHRDRARLLRRRQPRRDGRATCEPRSTSPRKLPLDTFGFNRLCVYRGTPLWQEYVKRGLVNDEPDWYKYFKCSEIDPTCLPGEVIHHERSAGLKRLFLYKLLALPATDRRGCCAGSCASCRSATSSI